ncbi:FAD-dependent monooxygenase [Streptomyces sp. AK010]|uniref:FAD-dependent monooxygenase n=1 Tax=Streptomyces sp. AK010 TaxID=2723074 RepID=UPI00160DFBB8|nr:FAD-dependent monooxygenase [Streptomyces sp. AK010]MBB6418603.1 2-polyprenyl-6-methoxyphenol hydroxylase-like FAD-dependent oxidoreductase [Streptomyces sp. AK010]
MRPQTFAVIGGGPAGLFLARLVKLRAPQASVTVYERNAADATFGFGVVFSDRTMAAFERADPQTCRRLREASAQWTDMELRHQGRCLRYGGYGFTAISRRTLLRILQEQATEVGAQLYFRHEIPLADAFHDADVVAVADGANSATRRAYAEVFGTTVDASGPKYIWFGTPARFDRVTFPFVQTRFGPFAAHAYPYEPETSTFIVETDNATWRAAGMDVSTDAAGAPGVSDIHSKELLEEIFKEHLDGHPLLVNNSKWASFQVVRNDNWSHRNMVLLGDTAHTAHFSVGSGTKMAMEDAIALAEALDTEGTTADAFRAYEAKRRPEVQRTQNWAAPSMRWWGTFARRLHMEPEQFGFHFLTRTGAISYAGLKRRHASRIDEVESWFARRSTPDVPPESGAARSAVSLPLTVDGTILANRIATVTPPDAVESSAQAGGGLVIVDWSAGGPDGSQDAWRARIERVRWNGAEPMALLRAQDADGEAFARAVGIRMIERVLPTTAAPQDGMSVVVGVGCPPVPAWTSEGEDFVQWCSEQTRAGAIGVHLRLPREELTEQGWGRALAYADLVRESSRKIVLLDAPDGWALAAPDSHRGESWGTRIHTALLSGRLDIVVARPLARL